MRRKAILLLLATAAALVAASGVAVAVTKVCPSGTTEQDPCLGTAKTKKKKGNDVLIGTSGPDYIKALSGNDTISGNGGNDTTDGGAGNDTYSYKDAFGTDTLIDSSGTDTVNLSRISAASCLGCQTTDTWLVPDWASATSNSFYNSSSNSNGTGGGVSFGTSVIEGALGSSGSDRIVGGEVANTLMPGPGGNDYLTDLGGSPERTDPFGEEPTRPALNPSADTYKGFRSGFTLVEDEGGSGDVVDLSSVASYDAHFDTESNDLLIHTTSSADGVRIRDYFTTHGRIEKIVFSDTTVTGVEQAQALAAASARGDLTQTVEALKEDSELPDEER